MKCFFLIILLFLFVNCEKKEVIKPENKEKVIEIKKTNMFEKVLVVKFYTNLVGHRNFVYDLSFSKDGKYLASGSADKYVKIWDTKTWQNIYNIKNEYNEIWGIPVAFSRDNKYLIIGAYENLVIYDVNKNFTEIKRMFAHKKGIQSLYISPSCEFVATAGVDGTISVFNIQDLDLVFSKKCHENEVWNICISEDNKYILSGGEDCYMKLWKFPTLDLITNIRYHELPIEYVRISYDGNLLMQASADSTISIWKFNNYQAPYKILRGHIGSVLTAVFTRDNKYVVSGGDDDKIYIYNIENEEVISYFDLHYADVMNISIDYENKFMATASRDKTIKIWQLSYE